MTVTIPTSADSATKETVVESEAIENTEVDTGEAVTTVEDALDSDDGEENEFSDLAEEFEQDELADDIDFNDGEPADQDETEVEAEPDTTTAESDEVVTEEPEAEVETEIASQEEEPVVEPEVVAQPTPEERTAAIAEAREKALVEVEQQFQLTEDEADDLVSDPNSVLPKMMAKVYLDLFTSVMQGMQQQLPNMITNVVKSEEQVVARKTAFYDAWPQLNKAEHLETIRRVGATYAQMNPKATQEDFIKEVGAQAWVALRLPLNELLQHTQAAPVVEPVIPVTTGNRTPAGPGSASVKNTQPTPKQKNEFEILADELLEEDN